MLDIYYALADLGSLTLLKCGGSLEQGVLKIQGFVSIASCSLPLLGCANHAEVVGC